MHTPAYPPTPLAVANVSAMAGIRVGTVILQANRIEVNSTADFLRAVEKSRSDKRVLMLVSGRGASRYVVLSWR